MPIYRPSQLHKLGIHAKKRLSQNFLIDRNILVKIGHAAGIQEGDNVLEIGPGPGALTEHLLGLGAHVIAIEKDPELAEKLSRIQTDDHRLEIICGDALTFPIDSLPKKSEKWKLVANLPYHITTPILQKFVRAPEQISSLTVMAQREFGLRMTAEKNTKQYSSFSLFLQAYSSLKYCFTVKPTSFSPKPSVHSCVITLTLHPFPFNFSEEDFFILTRTAFGKRRKMLTSSLRELYPLEQIKESLESLGMKTTTRPQELSLSEFALLFSKLESKKSEC